jgi:hypothetical protein
LAANEAAYPSLLLAQEDSLWSWIIGFCRMACGPKLDPAEVRLLHPQASCAAEYLGFFRCPVHFESGMSALLFARAQLERELPGANRELARANDRILTDFLDGLRKDNLTARVKAAISRELASETPSDENIANTVFLSTRSMHRKLAAEGTSYLKLLDIVRRDLAVQ